LSIKPLSGKAFKIRVNPTDTIYQVKQKIQDEQGILPEVQRLLFQGNQLENGRSLTSCEIQDNTEIFLVLRQRGG
ncbi:synthetic ubiquitin, partial [Rhizophagus irregularis DAOM 181602=DAOM 197198]